MTHRTTTQLAWAVTPLGMDDAATALGISRRTLSDVVKQFRHYELRGNKKVFYPEHINQLRKDMHSCASKSDGLTDGRSFTELAPMGGASDALSKLRTLAAQKN